MNISDTEILKQAYDAGAFDEYQRLTSTEGKVEFLKVCAAIEKYVKPGSVIYDIGCGPGRYTEYLINKGYFVGCADLSQKSLALFNERMHGEKRDKILFSKSCCASELDWINTKSADAILLLGPMYHIIDAKKRKLVISHCYRILKDGGYLLSMFMSPYPVLAPHLSERNNLLEIIENENYMVTTTNFKGFVVPQYRCWPQQAITEFRGSFDKTEVVHVDEAEPSGRCFIKDLTKKDNVLDTKNYSHQYFVIYKKK